MTDMTTAAAGHFRVGQTLSRAWNVFIANFPKMFLIALGFTIFFTLPSLMIRDLQAGQPQQAIPIAQLFGWIAFTVAVVILLYPLGQAAILYMAFQSLRGRLVSVIEALRKGLSRLWAIVGLTVLTVLGIWAGLLLLIVPGIMFAVRWSMALPACVVEGLGPLTSMKRSAELTKGHRWKLFGVFLLLMIVSWIVGWLIGFVLRPTDLVIANIGSVIWSAAWTAFWYVVLVMIYHDLRVAKEGVDIERLAAVFD
jgi:hypothetical protein